MSVVAGVLIYFGELSAEDCGHCDVCLKKSATGLPNYLFHQIANKLRDTLLQQVSLRFNELIDAVLDKNENSEENRERVIPVLRFLIDTGEFTLTDDVVTSVKKVEN
jgi:ATP-dependent DNA helicase RecQ